MSPGMRSSEDEPGRWTAALLWEACRRYPRADSVVEAISNRAEMPRAVEAAVIHRIGPLLWRAVDTAGELDALGEAKQNLGALADVHRMEALILLPRAVSMALRPLIDGGLEPVVLKGPIVAARYPEPGLRPMDDIDLLLPERQHAEALRILGNAGWKVVRRAARDHYDTVLTHEKVPFLCLELHYGLEASYERTTSLDPLALWQRRIPVDCLGTPGFGLPLPEEIVVLAAHAGKPFHGFSRLLWIADLSMVIGYSHELGSELDWERVRSVAGDGGCTTVVAAALALARNAGVVVPPDLMRMPDRGWRAAALACLVDTSWPLAASDVPTFHLRYALVDGWSRRLHLLLSSGHQMSLGTRVRWTMAAPGEAFSRWLELRRPADTIG